MSAFRVVGWVEARFIEARPTATAAGLGGPHAAARRSTPPTRRLACPSKSASMVGKTEGSWAKIGGRSRDFIRARRASECIPPRMHSLAVGLVSTEFTNLGP